MSTKHKYVYDYGWSLKEKNFHNSYGDRMVAVFSDSDNQPRIYDDGSYLISFRKSNGISNRTHALVFLSEKDALRYIDAFKHPYSGLIPWKRRSPRVLRLVDKKYNAYETIPFADPNEVLDLTAGKMDPKQIIRSIQVYTTKLASKYYNLKDHPLEISYWASIEYKSTDFQLFITLRIPDSAISSIVDPYMDYKAYSYAHDNNNLKDLIANLFGNLMTGTTNYTVYDTREIRLNFDFDPFPVADITERARIKVIDELNNLTDKIKQWYDAYIMTLKSYHEETFLENKTTTNEKIFSEKRLRDEFATKQIDVYDFNKFIEQGTDGKYKSFYFTKLAIIETPDGHGVILNDEAIGKYFTNITHKVKFDLAEPDIEEVKPDGSKVTHIAIAPKATAQIAIKDIQEEVEKETILAKDFFERCYGYNMRCEANLNEALEYLEDNGYFDYLSTETFLESANNKDKFDELLQIADIILASGCYVRVASNKALAQQILLDINNGEPEEWFDLIYECCGEDVLKRYFKVSYHYGYLSSRLIASLEDYLEDRDAAELNRLISHHIIQSKFNPVEDILEKHLEEIIDNPYPSEEDYTKALLWLKAELERLIEINSEETFLENHRWDDIELGVQIAKIFQNAFKGECGPFGGENALRTDNTVILHSQGPKCIFTFGDDGSVHEEIEGDDETDEYEHLEYDYDSFEDFIRKSDCTWIMYFKDEHFRHYNKILDLISEYGAEESFLEGVTPVTYGSEKVLRDPLTEELERITAEDEAWLDKKIKEHNFSIVSKRDYGYGDRAIKNNVHYQIISNEGNKTEADFHKEIDWIDELLDEFEGLSGSPCTYNMGLQVDGYISCGFDCRATSSHYKDQFLESKLQKEGLSWNLRNMKTKLIPTGLNDDIYLEILQSLQGQLSDGLWEGSSRYEKYWKYINYVKDPATGEVCIEVPEDYRWYFTYDWNDNSIKEWVAKKIKEYVKTIDKKDWYPNLDLSWRRDNMTEVPGFDQPLKYLYATYDALLGRKDRINKETFLENKDKQILESATDPEDYPELKQLLDDNIITQQEYEDALNIDWDIYEGDMALFVEGNDRYNLKDIRSVWYGPDDIDGYDGYYEVELVTGEIKKLAWRSFDHTSKYYDISEEEIETFLEAYRNKETNDVGDIIKDFGNGYVLFRSNKGHNYQTALDSLEELSDEGSNKKADIKCECIFSELFDQDLDKLEDKGRADEFEWIIDPEGSVAMLESFGFDIVMSAGRIEKETIANNQRFVNPKNITVYALKKGKGSSNQLRAYFYRKDNTCIFVRAHIKKDTKNSSREYAMIQSTIDYATKN